MKKWLVTLGMTICLLGLTACGKQESVTLMSAEDAASLATSAVQLVTQVVDEGIEETYVAQVEYNGEDGQVYKNAFESWKGARDDIGEVLGYGDITTNTLELNALGAPKDGSIVMQILGSKHDASLEIVVEYGEITAITTNVNYSFGESMRKAGLNTLIGMGTVFVVLVLISFIISAFNIIPKIQAKKAKKAEESKSTEKAVDQTIAQIVEKEELSDDLELVAVISAAIASYENTSSDGFVVRSIRKAR